MKNTQHYISLEQLIIVTIIGFIFGFVIGFVLARKAYKKCEKEKIKSQKTITNLQFIGVILFMLYQLSPRFGLPETNTSISLALIAIIAGEEVGKVIATSLDSISNKVRNNEKNK